MRSIFFIIFLFSCNIANSAPIVLFGSNNVEKGTPTNPITVSFSGDQTIDGDFSITGNVGIGTSSPSALFSIKGASTLNTSSLSFKDGNGKNLLTGYNTGYFGINTQDYPYAPLHILGNETSLGLKNILRLQHGSAAIDGNGVYIEFASSTSQGYGAQIGGLRSASGGLGDLFIRTGGAAQQERLRVTNAGNIGVGTSSPSARFEVKGPDQLSTSKALNVTDSVGGSLLTVLDNGNVGIGTTTPTKTLDINGYVQVPNQSRLTCSALSDSYTAHRISANAENLSNDPFSKYGWHDVLAFSRHWGVPTFEVSSDGTTYSTGTLEQGLFSQRGRSGYTIVDGTTYSYARWTWHSSNISYSLVSDWIIHLSGTAPNMDYTIESSTNGSTWTTRHATTGDTTVQVPTRLHNSYLSNASYVRLTMHVNNSVPIILSYIKALTLRSGSQGSGPEWELPIDWDANRNIGIGVSYPSQKLDIGGSGSKIRMYSPDGTGYNCGPANGGTWTCS